jgi:hypothetical protein
VWMSVRRLVSALNRFAAVANMVMPCASKACGS